MTTTVVGTAATTAAGSVLSVEGAQAGDAAVLVVGAQYGHSGDMTPAGWQGAYTAKIGDSGRSGTVATRPVTAPGDTLSVPVGTPVGGGRISAVLVVLRGLLSAPSPVAWQDTAPVLPAGGAALVVTQQHQVATGKIVGHTPPGRLVVSADDSGHTTAASWTAVTAAIIDDCQGEELVPTLTGETALKAWSVLPLTIDPAYAPDPDPEPVDRTLEVDGQPVEIVGYQTSRGLAPARLMPHGATTVTGLLGMSTPWLVAHRGGSTSWPEHTERAYTEAVWAGAHMLEFSAARTSDGVWLGCHDRTLARLGGPDTPVSEMTWAQVEQAMSGRETMPARLDWLIEHYGDSHVLLFDPKYAITTHQREYLDMLTPYRDRTILKYSGDGLVAYSVWKARGFRTWAYGYQTWRTGNTSAWSNLLTDPNKDILSLDGPYSTAAWEEALAVGKPLTAHILTGRAEFSAAVEGGAVGAMVSGVGDWSPDF
ncbi:glycerophosphodiester phosphodiesterase [Actinomyces procaprae]|uniref:glycerophosphodiester phosphodiesterase n=1 Tax=Actinomyces procaprae TaxID=2560010 RepID=UPI00109E0297|nr:glycerophosphodiester phosphodiesterase family protein [Actinomyces procaprae]